MNKVNLMMKIDRAIVWILLVGFILFLFSGYAMVHGLGSYTTSSFWHLKLLPVPTGFAFCYHSAFRIYIMLKRNKLWNRFGKSVTGIYTLIIAFGLVFFNQATSIASSASSASNKNSNQSPEIMKALPAKFDVKKLAKFDGKNGNPAYVAIDGVVYDVSSVYRNGTHFGCIAGRDVSLDFGKVHPVRLLKRFPRVGTYGA